MELPTSTPLDQECIQSILEIFQEVDLTIIKSILYFDGWSGYEECGGYLIFRGIDDSLQLVEYGYCVMAEDNTNYFRPYELTKEAALEKIREMDDQIKNST